MEYKLVIPLPEAIEQKIFQIRKDFGAAYQYRPDPGRPHITLLSFSQLEAMEERIVQKLSITGMGIAPFQLEMKGFGSFPAHTIFIQIATKTALRELVRSLKDIQKLLRHDSLNKPYFLSDPVISVGRKLKPWQYEKGWQEYAHRHFTGRCIAASMLLLKRPSVSMPWQIVKRIEFLSLPIHTRQPQLFA